MGNHHVGSAFAAAAKVFWLVLGDNVPTKDLALTALDAVGFEYTGADAEFNDEFHEQTDLSRMVAIAFDATPDDIASLNGELESEAPDFDGEQWYYGPQRRFRDRYKFC